MKTLKLCSKDNVCGEGAAQDGGVDHLLSLMLFLKGHQQPVSFARLVVIDRETGRFAHMTKCQNV